MDWFEIDKSGLAAIIEKRGKAFAIFELIQNAWDSGATRVDVRIEPLPGVPFAKVEVEDDSTEGWSDLRDAFTMFGKSRRAVDANKRGRFCFGEKLALALCRSASIHTMQGRINFDEGGRRTMSGPIHLRERGTKFNGEMRMTREELAEVTEAMAGLIPAIYTTLNGERLSFGAVPLKTFRAKLPTETADADGVLRRTVRDCEVEVFSGDTGGILEMGIPVCSADWPWRLNVMQKVPLGFDRDAVTDAFRRALQVAATNAMADTLTPEQTTETWAAEALGDSRIQPSAVKAIITGRFGERAVAAVVGDPLANATAEAAGYTVIHGGSMSGDAWANVKKHQTILPANVPFPTATPEQRAAGQQGKCPLCGSKISA